MAAASGELRLRGSTLAVLLVRTPPACRSLPLSLDQLPSCRALERRWSQYRER